MVLFRKACILILAVSFAGTAAAVNLADVSSVLITGGSALSKVMWAACIVVGIALIAAAFVQFQIHRRNPKLVPLTTPVMYLILGICSIAIPFIDQGKGFLAAGQSGVKSEPARPGKQNYDPNDIDAPINR